MFEKEAEEIMRQNGCRTHSGNFIQADKVCELIQKGAEFGYNKANEWHYVKDGDYPKDNKPVLCILGDNAWGVSAWKEIVLPELPKESEQNMKLENGERK